MKKILSFLFLFIIVKAACFSQSLISTASGKSGILVGGTPDFAGINYETASDRFSVNYKFVKQGNPTAADAFPNYWGINVESGAKIEKGKTNLFSDQKWQGGIDFDLTWFYTCDKTVELGGEGEHKKANYKSGTIYFRINNGLERFYNFDRRVVNADTTFLTLRNPLQNAFTITPGYFHLSQWRSEWFVSWGLSANCGFINKSYRKLTETNLFPTTGTFFNATDTSQLQLVGKQATYYEGAYESEFLFVPRGDFFIRKSLGNDMPYLGLLVSYSPIISSLDGVKTRNCFAFGPTLGLYTFPDQAVIAIMNELVQDKKGAFKYSLTLNASLPIKFK